MKKIYFIIVLMVLAVKNYGQTYHPFPTNTGTWTHERLDQFWNPTGLLSVDHLGGDTLIGVNSYKKLYVNNNFHGAIRENNRVVYFYSLDSLREFVLYDFLAQIGDTLIEAYDEWGNLIGVQNPIIVQMVDSIQLVDGNYRKKWLFNSCGEWIEGVGSTSNLLAPAYPCSLSGGWRLNCFVDSSGLVYSSNGTCITSINEPKSDLTSLKVFPNPGNDILSIKASISFEKNSCYKIRDESGKVVQEKSSIPLDVNIKSLSKGVYFISFENNGRTETRTFIKY